MKMSNSSWLSGEMQKTNKKATRVQVFDKSNMLLKSKRSQSEIVGFVLIVVLVVIAAMIFLVISAKKDNSSNNDAQIQNMLAIMMAYTTDCAPVFEPQYDSLRDLVKSCYNSERCTNLNKMACESLNETLGNLMADLQKTETGISSYQLDISENNSGSVSPLIPSLKEGNCSGKVSGAQQLISTDSGNIILLLRFCYS
jgi:hypothetical protein